MARLPESRLLSLRSNLKDEQTTFIKRSSISANTSLNTSEEKGKLISIHIGDHVPLNTLNIEWPEKTDAVCLHCAEKIISKPFPAVKYYDAHEDKFWVYGYFCRPCCALAYVNEHPSTDNTRCLLWTQQVIRKFFGYKGLLNAAPPRCAMKKFGGSIELSTFYGEDDSALSFKAIHAHPFVTFSMYVELMGKTTANVIQQENKEVHGLRRPNLANNATISKRVTEREQTEKPPLILNFLAKRGLGIKATGKTQSESTEMETTETILAAQPEVASETPKKRKIVGLNKKSLAFGSVLADAVLESSKKGSNATTTETNPSASMNKNGGGNLSKYLLK